MPKKIKNFYSLIIIALVIQLLSTVCCLSKNIAYGQNIKALEQQKRELLTEISQLDQNIAQEIAIHSLTASESFSDIHELAFVKGHNQALASR